MMLYDENNFVGKDKKHFLTAFPGKIETIKKQPSGNLIVTLTTKKDEKVLKREAIFKAIEIETYKIEEFLKEGKSLNVFGIFNKKKTIFPVCFVKVKKGSEIQTIEFNVNFPQYTILLEQVEKAQQTDLDKWKKD